MRDALGDNVEPLPRTGQVRRFADALFGHRAFRFVVSGAAAIAVDTGLLYLLHGRFGVWLPLATLLAVAAAFGVNFSLNRLWTFASDAAVGGQMVRYLTLAGGNWVFNVAMVTGLAALGLHYLVAKLVTVVIAAMLNYVGYRRWVFR